MTDEEFEVNRATQITRLVNFFKTGKATEIDWQNMALNLILYLDEYGANYNMNDQKLIKIMEGEL